MKIPKGFLYFFIKRGFADFHAFEAALKLVEMRWAPQTPWLRRGLVEAPKAPQPGPTWSFEAPKAPLEASNVQLHALVGRDHTWWGCPVSPYLPQPSFNVA